ncbi:MAG: hypothetical protein ACFCUU_17335 [Cyclobacteriaceae bacterium]
MAKVRFDINKTQQDINLETTTCLMRYGAVYITAFFVIMAMLENAIHAFQQSLSF